MCAFGIKFLLNYSLFPSLCSFADILLISRIFFGKITNCRSPDYFPGSISLDAALLKAIKVVGNDLGSPYKTVAVFSAQI